MDQSTSGGTAGAEADDVDPDVRRFIDAVKMAYAAETDFATLPLPRAREIAERVRAPWTRGGPQMHATEELIVGGRSVSVRIHRPTGLRPLPVLVYVHGGGWTMFSLDTHDRLMREYAGRAGIAVVGVDYSLSPEAKFPKAIDELLSIVTWLRDEGAGAGLDPRRIAIGGDSAGANLSVATNLRLRELGQPVLAGMLLNYGVFDHVAMPSYARYDGPRYMLTVEEMDRFWQNYLPPGADRSAALVSPLRADLRGLPPAFLAIAQCDILADANRAMASKLEEAGVAAEAVIYEGATHSFLEAVSIAALADRALADASAWLERRLSA